MRIAVTGHRGLGELTSSLVDVAIRATLADYAPAQLTGITCLADGADQLFAAAVLDAGGDLEVVVPADQYRAGLPESCYPTYDTLLASAATVHRLDHVESDEDAHLAGSEFMLRVADHLLAVWDGEPARGRGGTADIVALAHETGTPVAVIWPEGATRS